MLRKWHSTLVVYQKQPPFFSISLPISKLCWQLHLHLE
jgi:hypothetical protein